MLLSNSYDPDPRVRQEALALLRLGCRVRILAWDRDLKSPAVESIEGVDVERVFIASTHGRGATQILFYGWLYAKMFWRGLGTRFDAIHCHDLDTLPLGFMLGKVRRKPIIYDAHESFPDMLEGSVSPALRRVLVLLENFLIRRIDLLITVGEKLRQHFVARGARKSVVVGNWKRPAEFSRTAAQIAEMRQALGVPDGSLIVVCITQLLKDRKIEELLRAVDAGGDVYLLIGGKGILEDLVVRTAATNPRVRFLGFVSGKQIADYTCAADVVYYGFDPANPNARFSAPNKLFEALAAGRPLITGDFGEIADVVRDAQCGIVIAQYTEAAVRSAIAEMRDVGRRSSMAENARRFGSVSMNWDKGEEILRREYTRLLPGISHPARPEALGISPESAAR